MVLTSKTIGDISTNIIRNAFFRGLIKMLYLLVYSQLQPSLHITEIRSIVDAISVGVAITGSTNSGNNGTSSIVIISKGSVIATLRTLGLSSLYAKELTYACEVSDH